jgi:hypothetical protein
MLIFRYVIDLTFCYLLKTYTVPKEISHRIELVKYEISILQVSRKCQIREIMLKF